MLREHEGEQFSIYLYNRKGYLSDIHLISFGSSRKQLEKVVGGGGGRGKVISKIRSREGEGGVIMI